MKRRQVLKYTGMGVISTTSTLLLGSCKGKETVEEIVPIVVDTVFDLFKEFISNLELDDLETFGNWIGQLFSDDRTKVNDIETMLQRNGFDGERSAVYKIPGGTCLYGVENRDGFNLCAPCYTPGEKVKSPMIEGNAISGLLAASKSPKLKEMAHNLGLSMGQLLVPVKAESEPICDLYTSAPQPFVYWSSVANIKIGYRYDSQANRGITEIIVENYKIYFKDYAILELKAK